MYMAYLIKLVQFLVFQKKSNTALVQHYNLENLPLNLIYYTVFLSLTQLVISDVHPFIPLLTLFHSAYENKCKVQWFKVRSNTDLEPA